MFTLDVKQQHNNNNSEKIRLDVPSEFSAWQRIHLKLQALFSSKDKSKRLKCCLLQFLFGALRAVNSCVTDAILRKLNMHHHLIVIHDMHHHLIVIQTYYKFDETLFTSYLFMAQEGRKNRKVDRQMDGQTIMKEIHVQISNNY